MIAFLKSYYLTPRFFYSIAIIAFLFLISNWFTDLYGFVWVLVLLFFILVAIETFLLYGKNAITIFRILPEKFSNSDENEVILQIKNNYAFPVQLQIIDEIPFQFQKRDFNLQKNIAAKSKAVFTYQLIPLERGVYTFGNINGYASSAIYLIKKRYRFANNQEVKVYPSFIQMKKLDFLASHNKLLHAGLKKIRRIGNTLEFEQIKNYVSGDDIRTINWKATAKTAQLMVNQYQDEKMQPLYSILDASRVMKMPFNGLKLLDYAINSSLAFSNVALKKGDKVGLLQFSHEIATWVKPQNKKTHLQTLLEALYHIDSKYLDASYSKLQLFINKNIPQRSLLFLYTNFEHISALKRQLPYLKAIAKKHVLVVIFFENTEIKQLVKESAQTIPQIFNQTVAQQFAIDKKEMLLTLQKNGIQALLTPPEELSINTINKYLEVKARGLL